jgi:hypothetical protein
VIDLPFRRQLRALAGLIGLSGWADGTVPVRWIGARGRTGYAVDTGGGPGLRAGARSRQGPAVVPIPIPIPVPGPVHAVSGTHAIVGGADPA